MTKETEALHPATADLVDRFASALKEKLLESQSKYGWTDDWAETDWQERCTRSLCEHVGKGDPRDVAAFAAFMWHHGWPTALPAQGGDVGALLDRLEDMERKVRDYIKRGDRDGSGIWRNGLDSAARDIVDFRARLSTLRAGQASTADAGERAAIVAWLRDDQIDAYMVADAIERGAHLTNQGGEDAE